jgi:UDP-N-acetylmuramoylalanine--D-glutamate ligase
VDVSGRRFSIIGGARSGLAVATLLHNRGAQVFLSEKATAEKAAQVLAELTARGMPSEFGGNTSRVLEADVVVLSPGVPSDLPLVREALARGIPVMSELEVASWFCAGPIVAITGTNGKTTTTTLTARMLSDAHVPSAVAGNIGTALSQVVDAMPAGAVAVVEVSSFQLDHISTFRPRVAALLNITPDHLDRYDHDIKKYIASKARIFENQGAGDVLIYNLDDEVTRTLVEVRARTDVRKMGFTLRHRPMEGAYLEQGGLVVALDGVRTEVIAADAISIRGAHNIANAMAATLTARVMGVPVPSIRATLRNFKGVEHRLEFVRELGQVTYINDSKGTNVDSVWYALQSFRSPIVLLLGGRDKGNDYTRLYDLVKRNVRAIVAIGESAEKVRSSFAQWVPVSVAGSMEDAVRQAARAARPGDVVLLSPACASFDWFENYEHRGRVFKELVFHLDQPR